MAVRPVLRMGDPVLHKVAAPVQKFGSPELRALLADMDDTVHAFNGAGLAAPQIGVSLRVVIFEVKNNPRYPAVEPVPYTVLINPVLEPLDDTVEGGWEGCLSVPGLRGLVPRYSRLRYRGFDADGRAIDRSVTGFHARVVAARSGSSRRHPVSDAHAGHALLRLRGRLVPRRRDATPGMMPRATAVRYPARPHCSSRRTA